MEKLARFVQAVLLLTVLLVGVAGPVAADPGRLSNTPSPVVVVQNVDIAAVQNAIIGMMLPSGRTPVRQDANVMVYEFQLGFWQSVGVQMAQGNSGWQQPKGRQTFTMAQQGPNVMLTVKMETVATNMFNASNSIEITNPVVYNENWLALKLIAAFAEGRIVAGNHNALGITDYEKPTRKTRKIGYVIQGVVPGGPAEKAGLMAGDVVTAIGGMPTAEQSPDAVAMMGFLQEGEAILQVQGKGEVKLVKASRLGVPPVASAPPAPAQAPASTDVPSSEAPRPEEQKTWWDQHRDN